MKLISIAGPEAVAILRLPETLELLPGGYIDDLHEVLYPTSNEVVDFEEVTMTISSDECVDISYRVFIDHPHSPQAVSFPRSFHDFEVLRAETSGSIYVLEINRDSKNTLFLVA